MKASLLMISVLECVFAFSLYPTNPKDPESSVPRLWSLEIKHKTLPEDVNTNFEPPQPWTMKPIGKFSDDSVKNSIRIRVPNDFLANNERDVSYGWGAKISFRLFFLKSLEDPISVFTYHPNNTNIADNYELWEVDTSKRLIEYENSKSVRYELYIRPANSTDLQN
ncbi:hypothetical protein KQX54_003940 [Cotesia glomerata]|uniref:Uncharacterized protein n=1 Tax=Cotesia glomerata TaxID=32391 RepID=A0AAV7IPV7_COTGL|nr:hypothetical protein KQX54_003940 [Cotesia glomerata]